MTQAWFRFYAELNRFVSPALRQRSFERRCAQDASVKHMVEALGVPHTEVALILANGDPVDFSYRLREQDHVSVYPRFARLRGDSQSPASLQPHGLPLFVADAHLGRLARDLRMLGFDVLYRNDFADDEIVRIVVEEQRIVLTRDRDLLMRKPIVRGCYLYATGSDAQLSEVMERYDLAGQIRPLSRCLKCNGVLEPVAKNVVEHHLPVRSSACQQHFQRCTACCQVYWDGAHVARMRRRIAALLATMRPGGAVT
ncbi:Mut7-C RNAse domain-containing protein [Janthinobacterium sp. 17J80-10]|uniref:Mut7-C RNAse domain-containing protein n=1 Tax=Janthinobacterium sp. 17J80-10 TaxID=2497863 RepID=UPI001005A3B9|nr:Mut7-C RNAse domain-containing protein [Janthinobacterium sp. 17J80-10]QAU35374.1 twitching motility protein PilT [Janthinobacterium sp. 17J80-10]